MCQLIRFRTPDRAKFRDALSRIPPETWVTTYDDHARHDSPPALWTTLAALDVMRERGVPLEAIETLEAELIPVFYGPGATVHAKLMAADLRCATLASGAVGAIRAGEGSVDEIAARTGLSKVDLLSWQPPFSPPYVWLLIRRREEAPRAVERLYPGNDTARQWAERFGVSGLDSLLARAQPGVPPKLVPEPA
jgi:hypothetical protein